MLRSIISLPEIREPGKGGVGMCMEAAADASAGHGIYRGHGFYLAALLLAGLMIHIPLMGSVEPEMKIVGKLIRVDDAGGIIYVMHDSRIVKFRASKEICRKFADSVQSLVEIGYSRCSGKGFCVVTIELCTEESCKEGAQPDSGSEKAINPGSGFSVSQH